MADKTKTKLREIGNLGQIRIRKPTKPENQDNRHWGKSSVITTKLTKRPYICENGINTRLRMNSRSSTGSILVFVTLKIGKFHIPKTDIQ